MSFKVQHRIYLALLIAVILGCGLYFIGREAKPLGLGTVTQTFWADELNDWYGTGSWNNTARTDDGVVLSQLHPIMEFASDYYYGHVIDVSAGRLLIDAGRRIYLLEPQRNRTTAYEIPFGRNFRAGLVLAPNGMLYGVANAFSNRDTKPFTDGQDRLFEFDPNSGRTRLLTSIISDTFYLIADRQNLIWGFARGLWPAWKYDPTTAQLTLLKTTDQIKAVWDTSPTYGPDGLIYGSYDAPFEGPPRFYVAALDLEHHALVTYEVPYAGSSLTPKPDGGAYLNLDGVSTFNPETADLIPFQFSPIRDLSQMTVRQATSDGWLYGVGTQTRPDSSFVFAYRPQSQQLKMTYPIGQSGIYQVIRGSDNQLYATTRRDWSTQLVVITDTYLYTGTIETTVIKPISLVLTQTLVGNASAEMRALTCDTKGRLAGVLSQSNSRYGTLDRGWLFTYDPQVVTVTAQHVVPVISAENRGQFLGGTALVNLPDGRLVGGTNNGHVFVYDPTTEQTLDVGKPTTSTVQITTLVTHSNGLLYGGTFAYYRAPGMLFEFDPAQNTLVSIQTPLTETYSIDALSVAPDGSIYIGAPQNLLRFIPATRQFAALHHFEQWCSIHALLVHPNGKLYGGCGANLFSYDPRNGVLTELGAAATGIEGNIAALVLGNDGRVYGSLDFKYANGHIFVYDPLTSRLSDLGIALPTGVTALTTCGDGTIYGGTGTTESFYTGASYLFAFRTDCTSGPVGSWDRLTWEADTPPNTNLNVDVLDEKGEILLSQVSNGGSLQAIDAEQHPAIRLRANLSTSDPLVTPILKRWQVDYTFACQK